MRRFSEAVEQEGWRKSEPHIRTDGTKAVSGRESTLGSCMSRGCHLCPALVATSSSVLVKKTAPRARPLEVRIQGPGTGYLHKQELGRFLGSPGLESSVFRNVLPLAFVGSERASLILLL